MCKFTDTGKKWGCRRINAYDGESILHYPQFFGEVRGTRKKVFTAKKKCNNQDCNYGQRTNLSILDIKDIDTLYECGNISQFLKFKLGVI